MRRFLIGTIVFAISFLLLTVTLVWAFGDEKDATFVIPLSSIKSREPLYIENPGVYVVRRGGKVAAVQEDVVIRNENLDVTIRKDEVDYCPSSGLFKGEWGAKFDWRGRYYGGPAPQGLTTYPATVENGRVFVDLAHPREGLPRERRGIEPHGPFCS